MCYLFHILYTENTIQFWNVKKMHTLKTNSTFSQEKVEMKEINTVEDDVK